MDSTNDKRSSDYAVFFLEEIGELKKELKNLKEAFNCVNPIVMDQDQNKPQNDQETDTNTGHSDDFDQPSKKTKLEDMPLSALKKKRSPKGAVSKPSVTKKPVAKEELFENPQCSYCGSKKFTYHGIKAHLRTCMKKHKGVVKFPPKKEQNEESQKSKNLK